MDILRLISTKASRRWRKAERVGGAMKNQDSVWEFLSIERRPWTSIIRDSSSLWKYLSTAAFEVHKNFRCTSACSLESSLPSDAFWSWMLPRMDKDSPYRRGGGGGGGKLYTFVSFRVVGGISGCQETGNCFQALTRGYWPAHRSGLMDDDSLWMAFHSTAPLPPPSLPPLLHYLLLTSLPRLCWFRPLSAVLVCPGTKNLILKSISSYPWKIQKISSGGTR